MKVNFKAATVENTGDDDAFPGTFRVILSAPTEDRDGETLKAEDWKQPLPEHITFDQDHGMSVSTTVGSGKPTLDAATGNLVVDGTYSKLKSAQKVRTLVNEGHIRTTSVAFMTVPSTAKGAPRGAKQRELLNGAFVAVPSNRDALVLESKGMKTGARNNKNDAALIQQIHDASIELGASSQSPDDSDNDDTKSVRSSRVVGLKVVADSFEQNQQAISDALSALYPGDSVWAYPTATFPDSVVYHVSGGGLSGQWQASYEMNDDGTATLGTPERVALVEQIVPSKAYIRKDAKIDQAIEILKAVDTTRLPAEVKQAIALVQTADAAIDESPEDASSSSAGADKTPAAGAPAPAAGVEQAPTQADEEALQLRAKSIRINAMAAIAAASTPKGNAP